MAIVRVGIIILCIYASGLVLYTSLFILSANQSSLVQIAKVFISSLYSLVLILPIFLAQSRSLILRVIGYVTLFAYFVYVFFLTGYFAYFGFVPEIYALGVSNVGDFAGVSGHYFQQVFGTREIALLVVAVVFFYLLPRQVVPKKSLLLLALPVALFAVSLVQFGDPMRTAEYGNDSLIRRFGLPTFYYLSMQERLNFSSDYLAEQTPFPGKITKIVYPDSPAASSSAAGLPEAVKRVVLVQIESFDREAIDADLNGVPVMPFVANLKASSCREYTEFYTTKSVGGSSDSEFSVATGRLPSSKRQSLRHADFSNMETIYGLLSDHGIDSYFAHNNNIGFYGRNQAYTQMDDLDYTFIKPNDTISERQFAQDTLAAALSTSDRLFYYFFNFQSHGPYQGYEPETKELFGLSGSPDIKENYMATMYDVDQTIANMFALQQTDFNAGESLFILTADHPSYLHTTDDPLNRTHIPMLVCHDSFDGQQITKVASTVDLFPTILDAFGAPGQETSIADSLLQTTPNVVLFPKGTVLFRQGDGTLQTTPCDEACSPYFDYTNQSIRVSN